MAAVPPLASSPDVTAGSNAEFYRLHVGAHVFRGVVDADGPRIECGCNAVSLLHAGIAYFTPDDVTSPGFPEGWYVALDGTHPRIALLDLDDGQRERLATAFGLPVAPWLSRTRAFYAAPAFESLAAWVAQQAPPADVPPASGAAGEAVPEWLQRARARRAAARDAACSAG